MSSLSRQMIASTDRALSRLDVRSFELGILMRLMDNGPTSQITLARWQGRDRTTMVTIIDDLVAKKLVSRQQDPNNRRANLVSLTDYGVSVAGEADGIALAIQQEYLSMLSPHDQKLLLRLLQTVCAARVSL